MDQPQENQQLNSVYRERNMCVALFAQWARIFQIPVGIGYHKGENWDKELSNIVFIELPLRDGSPGQVSWHIHESELPLFVGLPIYGGEWDGHTTLEKYERVKAFMLQVAEMPHIRDLMEVILKEQPRKRRGSWTNIS